MPDFPNYHLHKYAEIGMALSGENDIGKLLEMIVNEAREIAYADAGTLYLADEDFQNLHFVVVQNDTIRRKYGALKANDVSLPPVPLYQDGSENHANVSSHVALTGTIINIDDVYECKDFDFTGTREYDKSTGYYSKSMLVIPMRNHEEDIIGVLQLLNAQDEDSGEITGFKDEHVTLVASLASQAAAALTKTNLILDLKELFEAFIKSIASAIEEKSRHTGGHIARVAKLTVLIAKKINEVEEGAFKDFRFTDDELEELRIAAWLHDIGKISTPEHVVDKGTKLEGKFDRIHLITTRFDLIAKAKEAEILRQKQDMVKRGDMAGARAMDLELHRFWVVLKDEKEFVVSCNLPSEDLSEKKIARLERIAAKTYQLEDETLPYLTQEELMNLKVRKGTLTEAERKIVENHARVTHKMLKELPFPKRMTNVPRYAAAHHEKLDGTGYPFGLSGKDIPLQGRIMAAADVFEALTAKDRPYKKPMLLSEAVAILRRLRDDRHIDPEVHDLMVETDVVSVYAAEELSPDQIDIPLMKREEQVRVLAAHEVGIKLYKIVNAMEGLGFSVSYTASAGDCFNLAREACEKGVPFDVVLVDRDFPDSVNAMMLLENLLKVKGFGVEKAVLINADPEDEALAGEFGVAACLPRRYAEDELMRTMLRILGYEHLEEDAVVAARLRAESVFLQEPNRDNQAKRILMVDDSVNNRMLLSYYLQDEDYQVDEADNGVGALKKYFSRSYDMVLMDLGMPIMDGYGAVKAMRDWEKEEGLEKRPIVAMTGYLRQDDEQRWKEAGFDGCMLKPVSRKEFLGIVRRHLAEG